VAADEPGSARNHHCLGVGVVIHEGSCTAGDR
jgi:hypothetical protein